MKYSIILLEYDPENKMEAMRKECRSLLEKHSRGDHEIISVAEKGQAKAFNMGLAQATGDYLFMVCSDVMVHDDRWLEKMAVPDTIVSWRERTMFITGERELEMSLFGFPRNIYEAIGGWDEVFSGGYGFDDDDFLRRARDAGFFTEIAGVNAEHLESRTFRSYYGEKEFQQLKKRNEDIFCERYKGDWKIDSYKKTHA
jgi:glycosyltransferase involved in cell wall biosynthesis